MALCYYSEINPSQAYEIQDCFLKSPYKLLEIFQINLYDWLLTKCVYIHLFIKHIHSCTFWEVATIFKNISGPSLRNSTPDQVHNPYYGGQNCFTERDILIKAVLTQSKGISSNLLLHCGQSGKPEHLYFLMLASSIN